MKIQRYADQDVKYFGGEIGHDYLPIGDVVEMDAAPARRGREWCVVETSWESDPSVISYHESRTAALRAVERYYDRFYARNPSGYGYTWEIGRVKDAASAAAKALGSMTSPAKKASSRANGAKGGAPKKYTYGYEAHLGLSGDRRCEIPNEVADNQQAYDGKTFPARILNGHDRGRMMRVRLVGDDYGLNTAGTGDIIVRPVSLIK